MMAKLTLRNLMAHKLRLILTAAAVILGVAFVSGTLIFRDTATRSFDDVFEQSYQGVAISVRAKQTVTAEDIPPRQVPHSVLTTLEQKVPGAESFHRSFEGYAAIVGNDGEVIGSADTAHVGADVADNPGETGGKMVSGRLPRAADEVVIDSRSATDGRLKVGDRVDILTQGPTQTMTISGIFTSGDGKLDDLVTIVGFTPEVAQRLLVEPGHYSAIWVKARKGVTQEQLVAQISAALPHGYEAKTAKQEADEAKATIKGVFDLLGTFLLVFAGVSIFVGSFIIFNTFSMLVAQRTRELALLRAVGASRAQVARVVLGEALGTGLLGSTLGLAAGVGVSVGLRSLFALIGAQLPRTAPVVTADTVLWSYVVGMVVTVAAAYFPARRAGRTPPVVAMRQDTRLPVRSMRLRLAGGAVLAALGALALYGGLHDSADDGPALVGAGAVTMFLAVAMLSPILSRPVILVLGAPYAWLAGAVGRLSRENARRDPRRTATTASALMIGLALVSMVTVLTQSMNASIGKAYDRQFGADFSLESRGLSGFSAEAVKAVAAVPGVRGVAPIQYGTLTVAGQETPVMLADPPSLTVPIKLKVDSGNAQLGVDEVLVQRTVADQRGWTVGSTVPARYPDEKTVGLRIAGIFADNRVANRAYIMTAASYRAHVSGTALIQRAFVDVRDDQPRARQALQAALRAYPNVLLQDRQQAKDRARKDTDQLVTMIMALLVLSIIIAALGIVNTLALSVIERTREIGLLRAVGMSRRQVSRMVRQESVVIAVFGAMLGLGIGVASGWAMQRAMVSEGVDVLSIPVRRLGAYLLAAAVIGVAASIWPAWRAARMNVLRAIAD